MSTPLDQFFSTSNHTPILCVGDIMLDIFVQGKVNRISPEAPTPVFHYLHETSLLGGVGNVARNLESLEIPSLLVGLLGDDKAGKAVEALIEASSLIKPDVHICSDLKTTEKIRFTAGSHQLLRVDRETHHILTLSHSNILKEKALKALDQAQVLVLSDYLKGVLSEELLNPLIQKAHAHNKIIIIDPKGTNYARYKGATFITPNRLELELATHLPTSTHEECVFAAQQIQKNFSIQNVIVTRGSQGISLITPDTTLHVSAAALEVFDVSGAGDTVVAVVAGALNAGVPLEHVIQLANTAGGIVVGKIGTAPIQKHELQNAFDNKVSSSVQKIFSLEDALDLRVKWQRRGLKVGFTNGCFDLLHPGHIHVLRESKKQCDRLIVGLNTDSSIKQLKGESRPLQSEEARALILSSLDMVDAIILFSEETPYTLITTLKPDTLIKGADYTVETVIGAKEVMGWGGNIHLVTLVPQQSTSRLVEKMTSFS